MALANTGSRRRSARTCVGVGGPLLKAGDLLLEEVIVVTVLELARPV